MTSSQIDDAAAVALGVDVTDEAIEVHLADGRAVSVPLDWYPRLAEGSAAERAKWELIGGGRGIHWPDLDEDIAVVDLLAGRSSGESRSSLERWRQGRSRAG